VEKAFEMFLDQEWQTEHPECGPIVSVDGEGAERDVFERILAVLASRWPETFSLSSESHV
jgi:hypothetical protein